jgi:Na+-translocating ferredoxin:NAD+ oxidoreductase RnfG subunit
MHWECAKYVAVVCLASTNTISPVFARQYLNVQEVQQVMFSGEVFVAVGIDVPQHIRDKMRQESGVRYAYQQKNVWKSNNGSWLLIDEVVGKHEMITYALGINANGSIQGVEIMEYNESYGEQIREKSWLNQFRGKSAKDRIQWNQDIKNITGATLSSKHVTNGVQRLMVLYREYLCKT